MDAHDSAGRPGGSGGGPGGGRPWAVPGYTDERQLGAGASGRVMLARHDATGTAVAVKYLAEPLGRDARFRTAFRGEAELLGGLHSPYIARFYEYVEDGPDAAIVMELVDGIALHTLLRQEGATDPEPALAVLKGSLLGLAAAHAAGVVHRDYKPANVLVDTAGVSKLVDFGVAVRSGESGPVAGTPSYMAPEQWAGGPATPATDVYAATATFYECLTGSKPYTGTTMFELAVQHAEAPIPDDQVPEPVRLLVSRGLGKTPRERPQSAAEFVAELQAVADAAYGPAWEERGQRKLAALVALLPLLLPFGGSSAASGTTALAHTRLGDGAGARGAAGRPPGGGAVPGEPLVALSRHGGHARARRIRFGRRARLVAGTTAALLISAGLVVTAVATGGGPAENVASTGATPSALTSLASGTPAAPSATATSTSTDTATGSPSASASASDAAAASASPSGTATVTATDTPADPPTTVSPTDTDTATSTATPTTTTPTTPPTTTAAPVLHISLVTIGSLTCDGPSAAAASVTVRGDGAADGTLTVSWFYADAKGTTRVVATQSATVPAGQSSFTQGFKQGLSARYPTWGLTVSTDPAAGKGQGSSQTLMSSSCAG
ncbi:serine/threonine-protein kinase [Actinacidiphila alni]|uniref:serine/threonine-protein kinase n=1 Tax=Actinacidiphila alni TaxID=380248 RepID=UPI003455AD61